jgi:hypothetical protein
MKNVPPQIGPVTFLVGCERSGTTLLRLMLDSHPEIAFRYEFEIAVEAMPDDDHWPELEDYYEFLRLHRFVDPPPEIDPSLDYPSLVRSFLEQKRVADRKPRLGATVHRHFVRLLKIWPDARFIHLVRDGRDVAPSCVQMGWYGNVWTAAERWLRIESEWDRVAAIVPEERRIDVHYEDLVAAPVETLTRICEFIGVPYRPAMLEYPKHSTYKYPQASLACQWPRKLTPRNIRLLESRMSDMLLARGYGLSGFPGIAPNALDRALLKLDNRAGIVRARIESLGPRLWLESVISRRLGPRTWRESAIFRVNDAQNAQLD